MLHISCLRNQALEPSVLTVAFSCPTLSDAATLIYTYLLFPPLASFIYPEDAIKVALTMLFL